MMKTTPTRSPSLTPDRAISARFHQLKKSVQQRLARQLRHAMPEALVRRAVDEAGEAAERTGFPLLVFPILAEETLSRVQYALSEESRATTDDASAMAICA